MSAAGPNAASVHSHVLEKTLEHRFLADLCSHLWCAGIHDFAVSQSEVDHYGYDVIVEVGAIVRHIQLKTAHVDVPSTRRISVNLRLAQKPSGCIVWMIYDRHHLRIDHYRWFGGAPGAALPDTGTRVLKHARGRDGSGNRLDRPNHRELRKRDFVPLETIAELAGCLFGDLDHARLSPAA